MAMKISKNTRVAKAGEKMANALIETVHILYLNDNALEYLNTLISILTAELTRRINES